MKRILVRENGLVGVLHLPEKKGRLPLVITLGGFRGGIRASRAEKLAEAGFASLAIAYFGCPDLPASLQEIPLEYFEKVFQWASAHPFIDPKRIALWGVSRGAELSLILGSFLREKIAAIAATVPSSAIYGAIQTDAPAWTLKGKKLRPAAPFPFHRLDSSMGKGPESALALTPYFLEGMQDEAAFEASKIPVEKIACPLLLISAEDDRMWPSSLFARQILDRLEWKGSPISRTHFSYPGAGHAISSSGDSVELHPVANVWLALGGTARENAFAKDDSWEKTVSFLRSWIC